MVLLLVLASDEEEVLGDNGEFVEDEGVVRFDIADGQGRRGVLERVVAGRGGRGFQLVG